MDPGSRRPRQNVVHGRFPNADPVEPEAAPIPDAAEDEPAQPVAETAHPVIPAGRRIAGLAAEWGWLVYLALALPVIAVATMAKWGPLAGGTDAAVAATGIAAVLARAGRARPAAPHAWALLAAGMSLLVAGDVLSSEYRQIFRTGEPFPSLADALFVAAYPLLGAGLAILVRRRHPGRDRASLLDTLVLTFGVGAVSWVFLIAPVLHNDAFSDLARVVIASRLLGDVALLGLAIRLIIGSRERSPALYLLAGAGAVLQASDAAAAALYDAGMSLAGAPELGRMAFVVVVGAAALHPSMPAAGKPAAADELGVGRRRLAVLTAASLAAPLVMIVRSLAGDQVDVPLLTLTFCVVFSLVVLRLADLVRHHEDVRRGEDALRTAGEALVTAASRDHIHEAAMVAARSLLGPDVPACLYSCSPETGVLVPVASSDGDPSSHAPITMSELPARVRAYLTDRGDAALRHSADNLPWWQGSCLAPLSGREALHGVLAVSPGQPLPRAARETLATLTAQLALALESAAVAESAVRSEGEARLSSLVEHASDMICILDHETVIRYVSPSIERVLGERPEAVIGLGLSELLHPDDRAAALAHIEHIATQGAAPSPTEFRLRHGSGDWRDVEALATNLLDNQSVGGIVLNVRDVSERKAFEAQLTHQAFHDTLTGLPNRALFRDRLEQALERKRREGEPAAILFLDLDDFKAINDSLGHALGDELLRIVSERLVGAIRSSDTAARLGGDEFAILIDDPGDERYVIDVVERIMYALAEPAMLDHHEVTIKPSIGIAFSDGDVVGASGAEEMVRNADVAMYLAKDQGKGRYQIFQPEMHAAAVARLEMRTELQRAVKAEQFTLRYQPIVDLQTERMVGCEALVRWEHPHRGTISPAEFIPLLEESGLIVQLGQFILVEACKQAALLQLENPQDTPLSMSVNVSARQLQRAQIVDEVRSALEISGIPPSSLVLELTESVMMQDVDTAILRLEELRGLGVRLAIDDFGTGYSSLNYIRHFPIDILKIDKSFVSDSEHDKDVAALTATIVDLARILDVRAVAEGIEEIEQVHRLRDMGCELGQGYYFARPLTGADILALSRRRRSTPAE